MALTLRAGIACIAAAAIAVLGGCLGSEDEATEDPPVPRVDSSDRFDGRGAAVADLLERWERLILDEDVEAICRSIVGGRNEETQAGIRRQDFCLRDAANDPGAMSAAAGGATEFDVVMGEVKVERYGRGRYSATARIDTGGSRETVSLRRRGPEDGWRIVGRTFPPPADKGFRGGCERDAIVNIARPIDDLSRLQAPREGATPRQAALNRGILRRRPGAGGAWRLVRRLLRQSIFPPL